LKRNKDRQPRVVHDHRQELGPLWRWPPTLDLHIDVPHLEVRGVLPMQDVTELLGLVLRRETLLTQGLLYLGL
jgi:hypothetical protein